MAGRTLDALTGRIATTVGIAQCFALIPGTSRSMATMVGGLAAGLDVRASADFAFLLAIPVLGAATGYEALKEWRVLIDGVGPMALAIGLTASFAVGWAAIAGFLRLLGRVGLWPFGVYRLVLAAIVWQVLA
jgi:undecaprenyl-diphosphatase